MADIRKRTGSKGTTYQVRYASPEAKSGYAYATFDTLKEARQFRESGEIIRAGRPAPAETRGFRRCDGLVVPKPARVRHAGSRHLLKGGRRLRYTENIFC